MGFSANTIMRTVPWGLCLMENAVRSRHRRFCQNPHQAWVQPPPPPPPPPPALSLLLFLSSSTTFPPSTTIGPPSTMETGSCAFWLQSGKRSQPVQVNIGRCRQKAILSTSRCCQPRSRRVGYSIVNSLKSPRGRGVISRGRSDGAELGAPRAEVPSRGSRWRGPAGIYGTTPWIVTCQPPPSCIGMRKRILDRYASAHMHPTHRHTYAYTKSVRAPPRSCRRPVGVSRGSLGFQKAASVADRWARCYVAALIEAHGETFRAIAEVHKGTGYWKNRVCISWQ